MTRPGNEPTITMGMFRIYFLRGSEINEIKKIIAVLYLLTNFVRFIFRKFVWHIVPSNERSTINTFIQIYRWR